MQTKANQVALNLNPCCNDSLFHLVIYMEWKAVSLLKPAFNDALNYKSRAEKDLFNKLFLRTEDLKKIISPSIYFLMGEKGAGKTGYAVYLENNREENTRCQLLTMTETQYKRFIGLKQNGKLSYSDYANIWRSMLLFLAGQMIVKKSKGILERLTGKFSAVEKEIEKWSSNALNPEVETAFEAVISNDFGGKIIAGGYGEIQGSGKRQKTEKSAPIRHHLLELENSLKQAISTLTLSDNYILFIDGLDYRPEQVPYLDYIECIKGLGEAIWQLNTEFFGGIRDSRGRIKIVLLVRPDVFHSLNLYNSNSRLRDNTVFLNWSTNEKEFRNSVLFELSGKYFSAQQGVACKTQDAWDHYFQDSQSENATFRKLLRTTFHKPRDMLTFISICKDESKKRQEDGKNFFHHEITKNPAVVREFSDYLLGEIKNYSAFYMTQTDFALYLKFFQFLDGSSKFTYDRFKIAFEKFQNWANGETFKNKDLMRDPDALIQFFYDVNLIGYSETIDDSGETFHHWSYRERSLNNIAPKIKTSGHLALNPGVAKVLDIGLMVRTSKVINAVPAQKRALRNRKQFSSRQQKTRR